MCITLSYLTGVWRSAAILSLRQHGAGRNTGIVCLAPPQPTLQVCGGMTPDLQPDVMEQEHKQYLLITPSHPTLQVCGGEKPYLHPERLEQEHKQYLLITPSHPTLQVCGGEKPYLHPDRLEQDHRRCLQRSMDLFHSTRKMGGPEFSQAFEEQLQVGSVPLHAKVTYISV